MTPTVIVPTADKTDSMTSLIKLCKTHWTAREKARLLVVGMLLCWIASILYITFVVGVR